MLANPCGAQAPPPDLARCVAQREAANELERQHYAYRQTVVLEELAPSGARSGEYREVREIIFSPEGERTESFAGKPTNHLKNLRMTEEDFRDIREVQPLLLTPECFWLYETRFRGEETVDDVECWVLQIRPRQILDGQRLFEGLLWVSRSDCSIVRTEGQAVPQILRKSRENLFPRFTTLRQPVDGKHWFPVHTHADDTLAFRSGAQRIRLTIRYENYRRFSAESTVHYEER